MQSNSSNRETYLAELGAAAAGLETAWGPLPFGFPELCLDDKLDVDGESRKGVILLNPTRLRGRPNMRAITIAHELAHQWWGLAARPELLHHEALAEASAYWWLTESGRCAEAETSLRVTRGIALQHLIMGGEHDRYAARTARQTLAIYACWRRMPDAFLAFCRALLDGALIDNAAAVMLRHWRFEDLTFPEPHLVDGMLFDRAKSGLPYTVDLVSVEGLAILQASDEPVPPGSWRIADVQHGPVFAGNIAADIALLHDSFLFDLSG